MSKVNGMSSFQKKLTELAKSPEVRKLTDKAQAFAKDPKTRAQIDKAKRKLGEMRGGGAPPDGPKAA